jgi:anti-anti-sigma regulatory factor
VDLYLALCPQRPPARKRNALSIETKQDESGTRLTVVGDADLTLASELKAALLDALSPSSKHVEIDLTQVTALNVTCLQLIWAAKTEAAALGVSLIVRPPRESAVLEHLRETGLRFPADMAAGASIEACA